MAGDGGGGVTERLPKSRIIALLVVIAVLILDQVSKAWVLAALEHAGATVKLPGPVDLTLVFNRSNAFGLVPVSGEITRWGLAIMNLAVASALAFVVVRHSPSRLNAAGYAFIIAGAVGNAVDRIHYGAVIDFFNASKIGFVWIFNVADASIDVGIGLLVLTSLLPRRGSDPVSDAR